jgi:mono/diheme cytochrome c family protein
MHDQAKYEPYEASDFYADGEASRKPVAGTVARGWLREDPHLYRGVGADGGFATTLPMELSRDLLERGRERYDIYCSPCHGRTGDGLGMIVQRGFKQPTSFHEARLREMPYGYFFDVMTNGFGQMSSYATMVPVDDRWAIAAYLRVLQSSRYAPVGELAEEDRRQLEIAR